ncbi:MAG: alpha/beta hydrolase [Candidatus Rokubacteria bacterium]|nr:alpha/beta hydrolase [Candidatus Rokubacteria bacterium]MBI4629014.1 alpha/beta hydrolase [Candidatus Rokubacteria bacterium]
MLRVPTNGVTLAAREWPGRGRAIVAVHGLTSNHTVWGAVADALGGAHRLVAYDLRGRGDSDKPATGYSLAAHAADLLGLLDHLGLRRAVVMGHSLGAHIGVRFATLHPERVEKLVLFDGGLDVRAEIFDALAPAVGRLGVEFPSLPAFLDTLRGLPMFAGRWNEYLTRHYTYDVEPGPGGGVRSKVPRAAIEEEAANLQRTRLWVWHHRITAPTLLLRAPDGLLTATDCLMTQEEAEAMAHAIPDCRLVVIPGTNHYTIVLGDNPVTARELRAFLAA